jgi:hypothetical protein
MIQLTPRDECLQLYLVQLTTRQVVVKVARRYHGEPEEKGTAWVQYPEQMRRLKQI